MSGGFESSQVVNLVGVKPFYLNKFVERRLYGIKPSMQSGKGRGRPRLFSGDDVLGIALVWWLFEAGLRTKAIEYVLNQICRHRKATANEAAQKLLDEGAHLLLIRRTPRSAKEKSEKAPGQSVEVLDQSSLASLPSGQLGACFLLIPVGEVFSNVKEKIKALESRLRGG